MHEILGLADLTLIDGLDTPGGMPIDDVHVFATAELATTNHTGVTAPLFRADLDGSNLLALAQDLHAPKSIALFGGRAYFIEQTDAASTLHGGARSISTSGGPVQVELATDGFLPNDVAVDASGVYVTAFSKPKSSLFRASGGTTTELASTPGTFYEAVRTNATAVYWTIAWTSTAPADGASVRKLCK